MKRIITFFFVILFSCCFADMDKGRIIFLMQAGHTERALDAYEAYAQDKGQQDYELLQQIALMILDQGSRDHQQEIQLLTLYGAGISLNEKAQGILEKGTLSPNPQLQLIALNFLARFQNDHANLMIHRALSAEHPVIRLEALSLLAEKKYPTASSQTEALMAKFPADLTPLFPQIFAAIGDKQALKILRRLLNHQNTHVRTEAILSAAEYGRDDLMPQIRILSKHHDIAQQEVCAIALGMMKDEQSAGTLEEMALKRSPFVRLAAYQALYQLGRLQAKIEVQKMAETGDLYAISVLGSMEGSEEILVHLSQSDNIQIRVNATLALLERKDPRCYNGLIEILIRDGRDLAFVKNDSPAKGLSTWKVIPSSEHNLQSDPYAFEISLNMREKALSKSVELPELTFLKLAQEILESRQNELVPSLIGLLENHATPKCIALLKKYQQHTGAPLIRAYCNLALYRLKEEGPFEDNLKAWVLKNQEEDLIKFRPSLPWEMREKHSTYQLTPQEAARLLIDSLETLASSQNDKGVDILVQALKQGNPNNRTVIAGLLLRATQ